ncbi:MAG: MMPL family transporter [bacterium]
MAKLWMRRAVRAFLRYRLWVVVILLWGVMAAGLSIFAPSLSQSGVMDETAFLPGDSAALNAQAVLKEKFPDQVAEGQGLLVLSNPGGLTAADREYATQLGRWLISPAAPPQVKRVLSPLEKAELQAVMTSQDGQALLISVDFSSSGYSAETNAAVEAIRAHVQENKPAGLEVALTGSAAMGKDMMTATLDSTSQTTWVTIILVVAVLLLVYKSPVASLVPLITVALAALVARGLLGWIASGNMQLSSMLDALTVVLVFGAGTDYVLFLVSRFREELSGPGGRSGAILRTTQRMAPVLLASAGTVILGLLGMLVASFGMIRSNGPAMALSILIAVMAALTLTPSLLFLFGRMLFWPFHKRMERQDGKRGLINWEWVGRLVTRKPAWVVGVVLLLLLAPYPAWLGMRTSFDLIGEIPPKMDSARGFALLGEHFPAGEMAPLEVILTSRDDDLRNPAALASLAALTRKLEGIPGVSAVRSALQPSADLQARTAFQVSEQLRAASASLPQFASPSTSSELAALAANGGASGQLAPLRAYLEELKAAFPSLAGTAPFQKTWEELRGLSTAVDELLLSARVDHQLALMGERLQGLASSLQDPAALLAGNTGLAGLTELRAYLEELGGAFPQVKTASAWTEGLAATVGIEKLAAAFAEQSGAQQNMLPQAGMLQLQQVLFALSSSLQSLQESLAGQPLYFLPQNAGKEEAEAARIAVEGDLRLLREGLTETASALAGEAAYLIPASFLQESPQLGQMVDHYFAPDGSATQLSVLLQDDPYSFPALETSEQVKAVLAEELPSFAGATPGNLAAYVGGVAAMASDMRSTVDRDFLKVQIVVVVAVFLVLVLLLRSLVAPLYLALSVIVSYGTTMGLSALIFQHWLGFGGVNYALPILVFVLLVALGSDYNIFLMSRVREETARCGDLHEGIRRATVYTGSVITSCGLILAGTFAALAFSPIRMLMQIGLAVALGVLIDTFLVRSLLVPALAALLGRWNWWPSRR